MAALPVGLTGSSLQVPGVKVLKRGLMQEQSTQRNSEGCPMTHGAALGMDPS